MRILLTAFEPYDEWQENSSWSTMVELLHSAPPELQLVTRRYPVELSGLQERLRKDLDTQFDAILHLGQSPGAAAIKIETIALNVAGCVEERGEELPQLLRDGPVAYRSRMPVGRWVELLRGEKIPAVVSYHAGTFLCNANLYLTHHHFRSDPSAPFVGFLHLPLTTEQVAGLQRPMPSMAKETLAKAVLLLLQDLMAWHETLPTRQDQAYRA